MVLNSLPGVPAPRTDPGAHAPLPAYRRACRLIPPAASLINVLVPLVVLSGWYLDQRLLRGQFGAAVPMMPVTALTFIVAAVSLWLLRHESSGPSARLGGVFAAAVMALGAVSLLQYFTGTDLWIDHALAAGPLAGAGTPYPGRMAIGTGLSFILLGAALVGLANQELRRLAPWLALGVACISIPVLVTALYDVQPRAMPTTTPMAIPTAAMFQVLSAGVLGARPDRGPLAILGQRSPGGILARRLLPAALIILPILGYVRLLGQRGGLYSDDFGVALLVIAAAAILSAVICLTARALDRADRARIAVEEDLLRAKERTEAANRELEAFAYSVSHDLRAPLRHIGGFVDLLERHAGPSFDQRALKYVQRIAAAARRMGMLIDDLLSFSRMGRAEMRRVPVDLKNLVCEVRREVEQAAPGRRITWSVGDLPEVRGDPAMLRLALSNLLSNAVKYTSPRPTASIEVQARQADGETVICVRDNGVGFDPRYASKLFGVFQRLHHQDQFEGTGIGLANVRRIIQKHGGRTWAEGEPERGAAFYFSLPEQEERAA